MTAHEEKFRALTRGKMAGGFTMPGAETHYAPDLQIEPTHRVITLDFDLDASTASGNVTTTVVARSPGVDSITLMAVALEDVVVSDPDGGELSYAYDGKELRIRWAKPFERGAERRFRVAYSIVAPTAGMYFSRPSEAYPMQATYAATDNETERARHWLPCIDLPNVRPTVEFHLTADSKYTILANGTLISDEVAGDRHTAHWKLDRACPSYLTCVAVGDFIRADDGEYNGRPIAYFTSPEFDGDHLVRAFGRTGEMLAWMEDRLGVEFPYPKYFQFALPDYGGAMENISLVAWDDKFMLDETLATEWTWLLDQINVHEMAHSYFGDLVICRDYAHAWLKESWATYMETMLARAQATVTTRSYLRFLLGTRHAYIHGVRRQRTSVRW